MMTIVPQPVPHPFPTATRLPAPLPLFIMIGGETLRLELNIPEPNVVPPPKEVPDVPVLKLAERFRDEPARLDLEEDEDPNEGVCPPPE